MKLGSPGRTGTPADTYMPDAEPQSHYFHTRLAQQFDAMIHIDETRAVEPLDIGVHWSSPEAPETYPSGL